MSTLRLILAIFVAILPKLASTEELPMFSFQSRSHALHNPESHPKIYQRHQQRRNTKMKSSLQRQSNYRHLQIDQGGDPICDLLVDAAYQTEYERSQSPCSCLGPFGPENSYVLDCSYDYCEECAGDQCGRQNSTDIFTIQGEYLGGSRCTELKRDDGSETSTCFNFVNFDESPEEVFCEVQVGDVKCNSCEVVFCEGEGAQSLEFSFDCLNVPGWSLSANLCTDADDVFPLNSPYVQFRDDVMAFDSCFDPSSDEPASDNPSSDGVSSDFPSSDYPSSDYPSSNELPSFLKANNNASKIQG